MIASSIAHTDLSFVFRVWRPQSGAVGLTRGGVQEVGRARNLGLAAACDTCRQPFPLKRYSMIDERLAASS